MTDFKQHTDEELHNLFLQDKPGAYEEIYMRYFKKLYLYAVKLLQEEDYADDILQDVFLNFFLYRKKIENGSLSAFLYAAVRNKVYDRFNHNKIRSNYASLFLTKNEPCENFIEEQINFKELKNILNIGIEKLPDKTKEIFVRSKIQEKSHKEICKELGLTKDVVKKQVSQALKNLKSKLNLKS